MSEIKELRVGADSDPHRVGEAAAHVVAKSGKVRLTAIGTAAHSATLKALAIARGALATRGRDSYCLVAFDEATLADGEQRPMIAVTIQVFEEK